MAITDDAHRHLRQFLSGHIRTIEIAAPFAPAQAVMTSGDETSLGKYCADCEFGHRRGVAAGRVHGPNLPLARRIDVDVYGAAARHGDQSQPRQPGPYACGERLKMR